MPFNIPDSIVKHLGRIDATIDFDTMSSRSRAMVKTYVRTGVMKTTGVTGHIAKYIRASNGMQYVHMRGNAMHCRNIFDKPVFDAIIAAITLCRMGNESNDTCHVRYGNGRWKNVKPEDLVRKRPDDFSVWMYGLSNHFHLIKLSDTMEVNTDEPLVVDLKKFMKY